MEEELAHVKSSRADLIRDNFNLDEELTQLRNTVADLQRENHQIQDRLDEAQRSRERVWELAQQCLKEERAAYQMHINASWQRQGGGIPYPDAPHLPPSAVPGADPNTEPMGRRRVLASELVAKETERFIQKHFGASRS